MLARMKLFFIGVLIASACVAHADDDRDITGRVIDAAGQPVAGVTVSAFWSGNGKRLRADGTPLDPSKNKKDGQAFWQHEGEMEPFSNVRTTPTDVQGRFTVKLGHDEHTLLAIDAARQHGGLGTTQGAGNETIEIRLAPLVRVHGTLKCAQTTQIPAWSIADLSTVDDPFHPLDNTRLAVCGTNAGRFGLSLPPGDYNLYIYGNSTEDSQEDVRAPQPVKLALHADKLDVDLGEICLPPYVNQLPRIRKAIADGIAYDYKKHYGEPPPAWNITEARGISQDAKLSDFKGKWVLLTFWGLGCPGCLRNHLPQDMKFYEDHQAQCDQFQIISICIDGDGELKTLADVDRALQPVIKNVWGGKTLPFPVLLDPTFETWKAFGIDGLGTTILIDPDGKMVEGDETTLVAKLK
ncbi:MAG TPA: redoxin domain-containing protein [Pirellulales bacterium]|nr:redoxin domain-containing protein [Pirellulales bacterium]